MPQDRACDVEPSQGSETDDAELSLKMTDRSERECCVFVWVDKFIVVCIL